ncbi:MAG TPA: phosphoenolpyruvate synthase [Dehalococcoidia bacterium]|nr:phosphoenolpyruvate synthase [Dehalococcoidia bacterium]
MGKTKFIAWFNELSKDDIPLAGGKGANLGEMTHAGIPVPPGFVVTSDAYFTFLKEAKLEKQLRQFLKSLDIEDSRKLKETSDKIKGELSNAPMPKAIAHEIKQAYKELGSGLVAVRSSATAEDLPEASFAGQQRTFLNVQGEDEVLAAVQGCWASLFEARAIFYRQQGGFDHLTVGLAVPVQQMVQSEISGVMFTIEPLTNDRGKILIEAAYGLGEAIVSGEVTPDQYVIDKAKMAIIDKQIAKQEWQIIRNQQLHTLEESNIRVIIPPWEQAKQKLTDEEIIVLAKLGKRLENLYQFPQDIEWAKKDGQLFIVQTRPVTTLGTKEQKLAEIKQEPLLIGEAASLGVASGTVKIVSNASQLGKVQKGDILVAEMTSPDFVPAMKRASAIVTDLGGRTSHAAIVSREMGIPCIVGTRKATTILKDGQEVTVAVDASQGRIYQGNLIERKLAVASPSIRRKLKTRTKVYVNLAHPDLADRVAGRDVDGVGLLRAEFIAAQIGEHPRFMLRENRGGEFVDALAKGISSFTKAFYPRPVVYRTTDFKTNEYRNLKGGEEYEPVEENPMIGYRGCSRYVRDAEVFKLEIEAIKKIRESYNNLWVMIPFVRLPGEIATVKGMLESEGLFQSADFKLWMMVEVPSNIFLIDEFLATGIDGISIGSNDLTQLILGVDRDSSMLAEIFDERNEAVMQAMEKVITACKSKGVTSSICGQAPTFYPEITEKLVRWGITSVSVSPDMIDKTREVIAAVEAKLRL